MAREGGNRTKVDRLIDFRLWIAIGALGWRFANLPIVLGEHHVYQQSYRKRSFAYRARHREMARSQERAIRALGLPLWTHIYPLGRHAYWSLPDGVKRRARRLLAGSSEHDVPSA